MKHDKKSKFIIEQRPEDASKTESTEGRPANPFNKKIAGPEAKTAADEEAALEQKRKEALTERD